MDIAQLVRAPDCGSGGRRFESDYPPHFFYIGVSSSGKTTDFDSVIRRFESCHPCQNRENTFVFSLFFYKVRQDENRGSATQPKSRDRLFGLPQVSSKVNFFWAPLGVVKKSPTQSTLPPPAKIKRPLGVASLFFILMT